MPPAIPTEIVKLVIDGKVITITREKTGTVGEIDSEPRSLNIYLGWCCFKTTHYQSAEAAIPLQRVPRREGGISGPETNDMTRTPPSKKVCLPPRSGSLVQ